jgi:threonine/homoserine/homoserine lactone efflux protein
VGLIGLLTTAFVIGLSGAMGPGSLLVVVVTETFRRGFWAGPAAIAGHAAVEVAMIFLLNLGLG